MWVWGVGLREGELLTGSPTLAHRPKPVWVLLTDTKATLNPGLATSSVNKYLMCPYCVPGTVPDAGDTAVNKMGRTPALAFPLVWGTNGARNKL